jgi:two-component system, LytTR family, response regulator
MAYKSIIIDDEEPARSRLRRLLKKHGNVIDVIDEAAAGNEALEKIELLKPEIIFLDIQMPGMSGFELLEKLEHLPVVIFTTAFEKYALKAFETNTIDYLLKPIEAERLKASILKIERLITNQSKEQITRLVNFVKQMQPVQEVTSLPVKIGDRIILVRLSEVTFLEAKDKYVTLHTKDGKEHITDISLKTLEEKLPDYFLRVHRAYIVNKNHVLELQKYFQGKFLVLINDNNHSKVPCSSAYSEQIKRSLEGF